MEKKEYVFSSDIVNIFYDVNSEQRLFILSKLFVHDENRFLNKQEKIDSTKDFNKPIVRSGWNDRRPNDWLMKLQLEANNDGEFIDKTIGHVIKHMNEKNIQHLRQIINFTGKKENGRKILEKHCGYSICKKFLEKENSK